MKNRKLAVLLAGLLAVSTAIPALAGPASELKDQGSGAASAGQTYQHTVLLLIGRKTMLYDVTGHFLKEETRKESPSSVDPPFLTELLQSARNTYDTFHILQYQIHTAIDRYSEILRYGH